MKTTLKWISNIVTFLLFVLLIMMIFLVIAAKSSGGEPSLFGYQLKTVLSGSMEPEIKTGSIIAVKSVTAKTNSKTGDVITFVQPEQQLVTHRIVEVIGSGEQAQYITKGDNNAHVDSEPVMAQNVVAEYSGFTLPYVGYFIEFAKSQKGTAVLLIVPGLLLLLYAGVQIWSAIKAIENHSKQKPENAESI